MIQKSFAIFFLVFLSACSSFQITPVPADEIVWKPSVTSIPPTALPSPTPTPVPLTASPEPTKDPNFFRDDFSGALDADWTWEREEPANWSLSAVSGSLQINVGGGYVAQRTNFNLLLRPAPKGNFQIETQINFQPRDNFQFAGLIVYESYSNFIQAGRGYCRTYACIGEGLYMNFYKNGHLVKPDFGQTYKDINPILLRLSRRGDAYTFEGSTDGKIWFIIGSHTSDLNPAQIGITTGQNQEGQVLPALFDYFEVRSLP
jgi:beta-xylosidase